jgi:hypothetical protein
MITVIMGLHLSGADDQKPRDAVAMAVDCTKILWLLRLDGDPDSDYDSVRSPPTSSPPANRLVALPGGPFQGSHNAVLTPVGWGHLLTGEDR